MEPIQSQVNLNDAEQKANRAAMDHVLADYRKSLQEILKCGGEKNVAKHKERGKMLARERIDALVDEGAPFLEFSTFAAFDMYEGGAPAAGVVKALDGSTVGSA